jgi:hypothetical protein
MADRGPLVILYCGAAGNVSVCVSVMSQASLIRPIPVTFVSGRDTTHFRRSEQKTGIKCT